tara:strand:- start:102 stop:1154 length:1053 start_codon:yes stop_codon:yes gene_type:complete
MIKNLSPSRASQYKTCPLQFKFANIDKIKEPTNEVQAKGTLVHEALEKMYNLPQNQRPELISQDELTNELRTIHQSANGSGPKSKQLHDIFREIFINNRSSDQYSELFKQIDVQKFGKDSKLLLTQYLSIENPREVNAIENERWVRGALNDLNLRGILDRMDKDKEENLIIVDYKSGKAPNAKYKEQRFFAMKLYALLIKNELGIMPKELKLIYLQNSTIHSLIVTEEMLKESEEEILNIWEDIKNSFTENSFPPKKNALCENWCYYKPICPLFNDNAPNTENLKNINEEIQILEKELEPFEMFHDINEIPESTPLKKEVDNINELRSKKNELEDQRNKILEAIELLLRK